MLLRTTRHRPIMAARWPANTAKGRVRGERLRFSLWSTLDRGLCKSGVRFLALFLGPRLRKRMLRGRIPGPPGGPRFSFCGVFFLSPSPKTTAALRSHCSSSGPSGGGGESAWSRGPSCRDFALWLPGPLPSSGCRRKLATQSLVRSEVSSLEAERSSSPRVFLGTSA